MSNLNDLFSEEAEAAIVGGVLINPDAYYLIPTLKPSDFFITRYAIFWQMYERLIGRGVALDYLTLIEELKATNNIKAVGGAAAVTKLINDTPSSQHVPSYAEFVQSLSARRRILKAITEAQAIALDQSISIDVARKRVSDSILNAAASADGGGLVSLYDAIEEHLAIAESAINDPNSIRKIQSMLPDLSALMLGGYEAGLIVIGGRPSMGKSAFMVNEAVSMWRAGYRVAIYSLEVAASKIVTDMMALYGNIPDPQRIRTGRINADEFGHYVGVAGRMIESSDRFWINDNVSISVSEIATELKIHKAQHGLDAVFIDYLQLMDSGSASKDEMRHLELARITRNLKKLSGELGIPVFVGSQVNRNVDLRQDKRPNLGDLKESGAIEQDADVVMFLYRPDYYEDSGNPFKGTEIIVAKNRDGKTGVAHAVFKPETKQFLPAARRDQRDGF